MKDKYFIRWTSQVAYFMPWQVYKRFQDGRIYVHTHQKTKEDCLKWIAEKERRK